MRLQRWILIFLLSGFIAAPAAAFKLKPGGWEDSGQAEKFCLDPEKAEKMSDTLEAAFETRDPSIDPGCKGKITRKGSRSYDYEAACDSDLGRMKLRMTVKKISDTEILKNIFWRAQSDEGPSRIDVKERTKKISEDETLIEAQSKGTLFMGRKFSSTTITASRYKKISDDEFVIHTTIRDGDEEHGWVDMKTTQLYRYQGSNCAGPDEKSVGQEAPPSGRSSPKTDD
ncbi:MAG: hypothetical protein FWD77_10225 [Betaproteobacteria bacterium]|nr:hypothetical protein [Betaproteobacteria bacterium]